MAEEEKRRVRKARPRKGPLRRLIRALAWVAGIAALLIVAAWLALLIAFPDEDIRVMLVDKVEAETGLRISAGSLSFDIWKGMVLRDVRLAAPEGFEHEPLIIDAIVMEYSPWDLLDDRLLIQRVQLIRPRMLIELGDDGRSNVQALVRAAKKKLKSAEQAEEKKEPEEEGSLVVDMRDVQVRDLRFRIDSPLLEADVTGFELVFSGQLEPGGRGRFESLLKLPMPEQANVRLKTGMEARLGFAMEASLKDLRELEVRGSWTADARPTPEAERLELAGAWIVKMDLDAQRLELEHFRLNLGQVASLAAAGTLADFDQGLIYALRVEELDIDLGKMRKHLPLAPEALALAGRLKGRDLSLGGKLGAPGWPTASASLAFDELRLALPGLSWGSGAGKLDLTYRPGAEGGGRLSAAGQLRAGVLKAGELNMQGPSLKLDASVQMPLEGYERHGTDWTLALDGKVHAVNAGGLVLQQAALGLKVAASRWTLEDGALNLQAPRLDVDWKLGAWQFLSAWRGPAAEGRVHSRGEGWRLDLQRAQWSLAELQGAADIRLDALSGGPGRLRGGQVQLTWQGSGLRADGAFERPLRLQSKMSFGSLDLASAGLHADGLQWKADTRLASARPERLPLTLSLVALGGALQVPGRQGVLRAPGQVRLDASLELSLASRQLSLERLRVEMDRLFSAELRGRLGLAGPEVDLQFATDPHRLEAVRASLPEDLAALVPLVEGQVVVSGDLVGKLPARLSWLGLVRGDSGLRASLQVIHSDCGLRWPEHGLELRDLDGKVQLVFGAAARRAEAQIELSLASAQLVKADLDVERIRVGSAATYDGERLALDGKVVFGRIRASSLWPEAVEDVELSSAAQLIGRKEVRLDELRLRSLAMGIEANSSGQLVRPLEARGWADWRLHLSGQVRLESARTLRLPGGLRLDGSAGLDMDIKSESPGVLCVQGRLSAEELNLAGPLFAVEGARGVVPLEQRLSMGPPPGLLSDERKRESSEERNRSSAYQQALRPLQGESRSFSIRSVRLGELELSDLAGNLELAGGVLSLGSLRFGFLEGDVVADTSVTLAPPGTLRLDLDAEMSGIDLSRLAGLSMTGASDVSGNSRLLIDWRRKSFSSEINFTQIGRQTLESLLLTVDPQESNPGVLKLRRFLADYKVAPRRVEMRVRHGLASMRTEFNMGLRAKAAAGFVDGFDGDTFRINHLPVSGFISKLLRF